MLRVKAALPIARAVMAGQRRAVVAAGQRSFFSSGEDVPADPKDMVPAPQSPIPYPLVQGLVVTRLAARRGRVDETQSASGGGQLPRCMRRNSALVQPGRLSLSSWGGDTTLDGSMQWLQDGRSVGVGAAGNA